MVACVRKGGKQPLMAFCIHEHTLHNHFGALLGFAKHIKVVSHAKIKIGIVFMIFQTFGENG
jgi:hypothetical protein